MVAFPLVHLSWALTQEKRRACDAFFVDVLGARNIFELLITPENLELGYDREESLLLVSDSILIPVAPSGGGLAKGSPIGDMLRRSTTPGMWLGISVRVADLKTADKWLRDRGIVPHYDPGEENHYCMIRRKETLGVRIEFMTADLPHDPRASPDWTPSWWRDVHPLGIEGLQSIGVSVDSIDEAREIFTGKWGWPEISHRLLRSDQTLSVGFLMGDCVIEALQSADKESRLARHAYEIKGIYCLTYKVKSTQAAGAYLRSKGLSLIDETKNRFAIDPSQAFDRLIYFTDEIPEGYPPVGELRPRILPPFSA